MTLLAFLTTTCEPCGAFWEMLALGVPALGVPVVVVTPSRSMEDERLARRLTPPAARLHMGSETWFAYGVTQAGTFVLVRDRPDGQPVWESPGQVLGSGTPAGPAELSRLVEGWLAGAC